MSTLPSHIDARHGSAALFTMGEQAALDFLPSLSSEPERPEDRLIRIFRSWAWVKIGVHLDRETSRRREEASSWSRAVAGFWQGSGCGRELENDGGA